MLTITRRLEFDYGHRVLGHGGKCRHLHGHRGVAEITVSADALDGLGMVTDFSVIKEEVGGWIDRNWDHNLLLNKLDPQLKRLTDTEEQLPYTLDGNPTAENMAAHLFGIAVELLKPLNVKVVAVKIWETPNCNAEYRP